MYVWKRKEGKFVYTAEAMIAKNVTFFDKELEIITFTPLPIKSTYSQKHELSIYHQTTLTLKTLNWSDWFLNTYYQLMLCVNIHHPTSRCAMLKLCNKQGPWRSLTTTKLWFFFIIIIVVNFGLVFMYSEKNSPQRPPEKVPPWLEALVRRLFCSIHL